MAVNASAQNVSAKSQEKQNMQESQTMPPQLRAARLGKQRIVKTIILTVTLLFLFVPLVSMFLFTIRHPLSGKWSFDPWIAIFTGDGSALGADLSTLWSGLGASLALCVVTVLIMLVLLVPTMVIVHIRSRRLERAIEWVATLPLTIECSNELGSDPEISSFVLPLGATINMDGTAIYMGVASVFIASCYGIDLTLGQMAMIVLTATLASIGTAGVSGAGMIMLAMVLQSVGLPVAGIGIIAGVDKLFDMGRTTLNITGDATCALYMSRLDERRTARKAAALREK